jgi:hypothetical protein
MILQLLDEPFNRLWLLSDTNLAWPAWTMESYEAAK